MSVLLAIQLAGFHCTGPVCVGRLPGAYPEPVAFVLPPGPPAQGRYILHLVGNAETDIDFEKDVLARFQFDRLLAESGRSEIMIIPANRGPRQTQRDVFTCHYQTIRDRKLAGPELDRCRKAAERRFDRFMKAAVAALREAGLEKSGKIARLALSGHSGAYAPMAAILQNPDYRKKIREVYCYDCMYGEEDAFIRYARGCPPNRFASVALRGERTQLGNFRIWSAFHPAAWRKLNEPYAAQRKVILGLTDPDARQRRLNQLDSVLMKKSDFILEEAAAFDEAKARQVFASETPDHFETVTRYLPRFLKERRRRRP
jgi:hypothetical protein